MSSPNALGYSTLFIHLPSPLRRLRARSKSVVGAGAASTKPKLTAESKKSKYGHVLPLANELALMQFADGGSIDDHAKRVMKGQARAVAGSYYNPQETGVGVVHRDEKGRVWWDQDEEYEYAHLLDGENVDMYDYEGNEGTDAWVRFNSNSPSGKDSPSRTQQQGAPLAMDMVTAQSGGLGRRESDNSDLDVRCIVSPAGEAAYPVVVPGLSVLCVPSRAKKAPIGSTQHLRKPEFLVDVAAFGPRSPSAIKTFADVTAVPAPRPKGKARRRPAPLKIPSSASTSKKPSNPALPTAGMPSTNRARKEFIENSFEPISLSPSPVRVSTTREPVQDTTSSKGWRLRIPKAGPSMAKNSSRLDLRAIFGAGIRNE